eukprot:c15005_g1_i1 orf=109-2280(+)
MAEASSQQVNRRQASRLLPKLASLAIRHADLLVVTSCIFGLIALLLLPALAKSTYISENALIPGSASPKFMVQDAMDAAQFARELQVSRHNTTNVAMAVRSFIVKYLVAMRADFYLHPFYRPDPTFSSMHFLSSHPSSVKVMQSSAEDNFIASERLGVNIAGILRAPQGEGNEAIVLVTPYDPESLTDADAFSLGLGLSLFHLLSKAPWLAKDIIWLAADSHYGLHTGVSAWLKDYHEPVLISGPMFQSFASQLNLYSGILDKPSVSILLEETTLGDFKRAGVISAGVVFNMQGVQGRSSSDLLTVYAEGPNGQMPNLDLINIVNNLAVYREGLHMKLDIAASMLEWSCLHIAGQVLEKVGQVAAMLNVGWKFGLPASEYVQGAATFTQSLILQALGVPTGAHGAFREYQIDAVTIAMSFSSQAHGGPVGSLMKFGRLLEGTIRSVNNLLEKFHQSFFLYLLTGPNKFVSVGVYTIPLLLLLVTLPLKAAALCTQASGVRSKSLSETSDQSSQARPAAALQDGCSFSFVKWSFAVFTVGLVELWALLVAIFPPLANYMAESPELKVACWVAFSSVSLCVLLVILLWTSRVLKISITTGSSWTAIKASILGVATIGIGIMSSINFAAALVGAMVLVPMCLLVYPVRCFTAQKGIYQFCTGLALSVIGSLPAVFLFLIDQPKLSRAVFWDWVECQWKWGSATYLYLSLVHLPCSVLCILVLMCRS